MATRSPWSSSCVACFTSSRLAVTCSGHEEAWMISWSHSQVGTSLSLDVLEGSHQIVLLASESQDDCLNRCCAPELETTPHPTGHAPCFPPRIKEILPVLHSTWATWQQTSDDSRGSTDLCSKVKSFLHSLDTFEAAPGIHRSVPASSRTARGFRSEAAFPSLR